MAGADNRHRLFEVTQAALDSFKKLLYESVPLSSGRIGEGEGGGDRGPVQFHQEGQIVVAAEVAKSKVISELKKKLPAQSEEAITIRVETLETVLDTILHDHLQENDIIRKAAETKMTAHVEKLVAEFSEKMKEYQGTNPFMETQQLAEYHEKMKANAMNAWNQLDKPGFPDFIKNFEDQLQDKLNEFSGKLLQEHLEILRDVQEKVESEIVETVQKFEAESMAKKDAFGVNMVTQWKGFLKDLQLQKEEDFVLEGKNTFPESHPLHKTLNEKLVRQLRSTRHSLFELRQAEVYPEAVPHCLAGYLVKMEEQLYGINYLLETDLMRFHRDAYNKALGIWDSLVRVESEEAKYLKVELVNKITRGRGLFRKQMNNINEVAKQQAELLVAKCQDDYQSRMRTQIDEIHQVNLNHCMEKLRKEFPVKSNAHFLALYEKQVEDFLGEKLEKYREIVIVTDDDRLNCTEAETCHGNLDTAPMANIQSCPDLLSPGQELQETEYFAKLYQDEIVRHRSSFGLENIPAETHQKSNEVLIRAFQKFCELKSKDTEDSLILLNNLKAQLFAIRLSDEESVIRERVLKKIAQKMKDEYNVKAQEILTKNPDGVEMRILTKLHENVRAEVMKLMEIEIKQKVRIDEPLEIHKQVLQCHIDKYWQQIRKENHQNLHKKREGHARKQEQDVKKSRQGVVEGIRRPETKNSPSSSSQRILQAASSNSTSRKWQPRSGPVLPPLVFHLQSTNISMAMGVKEDGDPKLLDNEYREHKTPAVVALSPEKELIYGTQAISSTKSIKGSHQSFTWTVGDFFMEPDAFWSVHLDINGKKHRVNVEFLLGFLLGKLKMAAESQMKGNYTAAVIAIPFWLSSPQRLKVKYAARAVGFSEVYLVNEASAAAYNFAYNEKRAFKSDKVLVISENQDRVDAFVYSYSGPDKKLKMLGNSSIHGINDQSSGIYKPVKRGIKQLGHFVYNLTTSTPPLSEQYEMAHNVRQACKNAIELARKEEPREIGKVTPNESLYLCENQTKWEDVLGYVSKDFGKRPCDIKEWTAVLLGAVKLSQVPKEIGNHIHDKMAYDVRRIGDHGGISIHISKTEILPVIIKRYGGFMPLKHEMATFYQEDVLGNQHHIGKLVARKVLSNEFLEVNMEVTNEAIVGLQSVMIRSDWSSQDNNPRYLTDDECDWSTYKLLPDQLETLTELLATMIVPTEDPELTLAKANLVQRCNEMIWEINTGDYKIKSDLVKQKAIEKITFAKEVAEDPSSDSMDIIQAQVEILNKFEEKYKK